MACGSVLFAYRNLKPFYKFRVPFCPLVEEEAAVWAEVTSSESFGADKLVNALKAIPYSSLSARWIWVCKNLQK